VGPSRLARHPFRAGPRPAGPRPGLELVILVGLPASGKTTFVQRRLAGTHQHVSKDTLGQVRDKNARQRALIDEALGADRSVVVDNINATAAERARLIELGRARGARIVGYHLDADRRTCLARNRRREGRARVPDVAILAAAKRLEPPRYAEGFDALYRARILGEDFEVAPVPPDGAKP
jgi:predicted kinase